MLYFLQGVFCQNQSGIGVAYRAGHGVQAFVRSGLCVFPYAGIIEDDRDDPMGEGELRGELRDQFGRSEIVDFLLEDGRLTFLKRYEGRDDLIHYSFEVRDGDIWTGTFQGEKVGVGITRCLVVPVRESFFDVTEMLQLLGLEKAHEWRGADASS